MLGALAARYPDGAPLRLVPDLDSAWMPALTFFVYVAVNWWASWYPGAEPGGGGYVAQRILSTRDERHALLAAVWFNIAHYALRPWPWIVVALASMVLYPGLADPESGYVRVMVDHLPPSLRGLMVAAFGLASSGFSPGLGLFLVLVSITAVGVSTFHPVMYAIIDRRSGGDKGRFLGLYESFGIGAILIMFLVNGLLFKWIGIRGVMLATALPAAVIGILYLRSSDEAFAPARQMEDLRQVLAASGLALEADVCPRCRRRAVGVSQGRLLAEARRG